MSAIKSALKLLGEGAFICQTRYPEEFEALQEPQGQEKAEQWLGDIGYRLSRLSDDGAFFMAHSIVTSEMRAKLREEMRNVRSKFQPVVGFLETLRQSQGRDPRIHAGEVIWGSEITEAVRTSSLLERRVMDMRDINGARPTDSVSERVNRMLASLESEGYLTQSDAAHRGYKITGKVDYLYQMISFMAANTPHLSDDEVVDQIEQQPRLNDAPGQAAPQGNER